MWLFGRRKVGELRMNGDSWLVVGLGNPGGEYSGNRHNVGYMVVDHIADEWGWTFRRAQKIQGTVASGVLSNKHRVALLKSNSFMNRSGGSIAAAMKYYGISAQNVIVVHDELDLPFRTLRLKFGGGHGGHNGLRDAIKATDTNDFVRVRVGIGRPQGRQDPSDFVLRDFSSVERGDLPALLADVANAVQLIITEGLPAAQQSVHSER